MTAGLPVDYWGRWHLPNQRTGATTLNIQLHHFESDKGDGLGTIFDTDLNVNFPVSVQ